MNTDDDFVGLWKRKESLEKDNAALMEENKIMSERLASKRYRVIDFWVDSFYKLVGKNRKKTKVYTVKKSVVCQEIRRRGNKNKKVDIININFFDWDGKIVYKGGAERYVYDLACLLKKNGYSPRILQCSNVKFEKQFKGITVVGIGAGNKSDVSENSRIYDDYCCNDEFIIASPLELACNIKHIPVIGINHGINFDGEWICYDEMSPYRYDYYMDSLKNVDKCVCVDTNFINWTRTQDYALSLKEKYVPNYYNEKQFSEVLNENIKKKIDNNKVVFVYPRRLYSARGYDITIKVFRKVFDKYNGRKKIILNFVGQIDNEKVECDLRKIMDDFPENVFHYEYDMENMQKAYEGVDVTLIPTRYSEGTSLSCIEGMASGTAVIATDVGGLPNLIIDGFNGLIVSPSVDDLFDAVVKVIDDPKLRRRLAKNGAEVAKNAFEKKKWEETWQGIIKSMECNDFIN